MERGIKGTRSVRWFVNFVCSFDPIYVEKFAEISSILCLLRIGEYGKILLAFSPYALKYFLPIFRVSLNTFCVFGDDFLYHKPP
jgi:hypothetical protein